MLLRILLFTLFLVSTKSFANMYFGFDVGEETVREAVTRLQISGAKLKLVRYGHYDNLLAGASTADKSYRRNHELGLINNIILKFLTTPESDLNTEIDVRRIHSVSIYIDGDEGIGDRVQGLLNKKYGNGEKSFGGTYMWKTNDTLISMKYLGLFGSYTTILTYTDIELNDDLRNAIQQQKAKKKREQDKQDQRLMQDL